MAADAMASGGTAWLLPADIQINKPSQAHHKDEGLVGCHCRKRSTMRKAQRPYMQGPGAEA
eukprot:832067-Amphidinium_carterae.1